MDTDTYLGYVQVDNYVANRLDDNSLVHTLTSNIKLKKVTKAINKEIKKIVNKQSHSKVLSLIENLKNKIDDGLVSDESDLSDEEIESFYKNVDYSYIKNSENFNIEDCLAWLFISDKKESLTDTISKSPNTSTFKNKKAKKSFSNQIAEKKNVNIQKENFKLKNVKKNLFQVDNSCNDNSQFLKDDWIDDITVSDFQAQSTKIFSDDCIENSEKKRKISNSSNVLKAKQTQEICKKMEVKTNKITLPTQKKNFIKAKNIYGKTIIVEKPLQLESKISESIQQELNHVKCSSTPEIKEASTLKTKTDHEKNKQKIDVFVNNISFSDKICQKKSKYFNSNGDNFTKNLNDKNESEDNLSKNLDNKNESDEEILKLTYLSSENEDHEFEETDEQLKNNVDNLPSKEIIKDGTKNHSYINSKRNFNSPYLKSRYEELKKSKLISSSDNDSDADKQQISLISRQNISKPIESKKSNNDPSEINVSKKIGKSTDCENTISLKTTKNDNSQIDSKLKNTQNFNNEKGDQNFNDYFLKFINLKNKANDYHDSEKSSYKSCEESNNDPINLDDQENINLPLNDIASQEMFSSTENLAQIPPDSSDLSNHSVNSFHSILPEKSNLNNEEIDSTLKQQNNKNKLTEIFDLVEKENLLKLDCKSTLTIDDISDDHEIFFLEVPKNVFETNLVNESISFSNNVLSLGPIKYEAFDRHIPSTYSCVLTSGKNENLKTYELKPILSVIARRKKQFNKSRNSKKLFIEDELATYDILNDVTSCEFGNSAVNKNEIAEENVKIKVADTIFLNKSKDFFKNIQEKNKIKSKDKEERNSEKQLSNLKKQDKAENLKKTFLKKLSSPLTKRESRGPYEKINDQLNKNQIIEKIPSTLNKEETNCVKSNSDQKKKISTKMTNETNVVSASRESLKKSKVKKNIHSKFHIRNFIIHKKNFKKNNIVSKNTLEKTETCHKSDFQAYDNVNDFENCAGEKKNAENTFFNRTEKLQNTTKNYDISSALDTDKTILAGNHLHLISKESNPKDNDIAIDSQDISSATKDHRENIKKLVSFNNENVTDNNCDLEIKKKTRKKSLSLKKNQKKLIRSITDQKLSVKSSDGKQINDSPKINLEDAHNSSSSVDIIQSSVANKKSKILKQQNLDNFIVSKLGNSVSESHQTLRKSTIFSENEEDQNTLKNQNESIFLEIDNSKNINKLLTSESSESKFQNINSKIDDKDVSTFTKERLTQVKKLDLFKNDSDSDNEIQTYNKINKKTNKKSLSLKKKLNKLDTKKLQIKSNETGGENFKQITKSIDDQMLLENSGYKKIDDDPSTNLVQPSQANKESKMMKKKNLIDNMVNETANTVLNSCRSSPKKNVLVKTDKKEIKKTLENHDKSSAMDTVQSTSVGNDLLIISNQSKLEYNDIAIDFLDMPSIVEDRLKKIKKLDLLNNEENSNSENVSKIGENKKKTIETSLLLKKKITKLDSALDTKKKLESKEIIKTDGKKLAISTGNKKLLKKSTKDKQTNHSPKINLPDSQNDRSSSDIILPSQTSKKSEISRNIKKVNVKEKFSISSEKTKDNTNQIEKSVNNNCDGNGEGKSSEKNAILETVAEYDPQNLIKNHDECFGKTESSIEIHKGLVPHDSKLENTDCKINAENFTTLTKEGLTKVKNLDLIKNNSDSDNKSHIIRGINKIKVKKTLSPKKILKEATGKNKKIKLQSDETVKEHIKTLKINTIPESKDNNISSTNFVQPSHVSKKSKKIKKHKLLDNILGETENTLDNENVKDNNRLKKKSVDSSKYSLKDQVQSNVTSESNLISSQNDGFSTDTIQSSQISEKSKKRKKKKENSGCQEEKLLLNSEQNLSTNQDKCFPGDEKKSAALEDNSNFSLQKLKVENIDNKIDAQDVSIMTKERLTQVKKLDLFNNDSDSENENHMYNEVNKKPKKKSLSLKKKLTESDNKNIKVKSIENIGEDLKQLTKSICSQVLPKNIKCKQIHTSSNITVAESEDNDISSTNFVQPSHVSKKSKKIKKHKLLDNILGETENTLDNENVKDNNRLKKKSVDSSKYSLKDQVQSNVTSESNLISSQNDGFSTDTIQSSQISEKSKKRKKKKANSECQEEKLLLNSAQNLSTNLDKCFPGDEKKSAALEDNSNFSLQKLKVENIDNKIDAQDVSIMTKERLTQVKKLDLFNNDSDSENENHMYNEVNKKPKKKSLSLKKKLNESDNKNIKIKSIENIGEDLKQLTKSICSQVLPKNIKCKQIHTSSNITVAESEDNDISSTNFVQPSHVSKKSKKIKKHKLLDNILGETENTLDNENVKDNNRLKKKSVDSSKYSLKDQVQSNVTSESNLISSQNDGFSTDTIQSSQISEKSKKRKKKKANSECQEEKLLLNSAQNLSTNLDKCFPGDEKKSAALEDNSNFSLQKLKVENIDNKIDAQDVSIMTKERLTQVKKLDLFNNDSDSENENHMYNEVNKKPKKKSLSLKKKLNESDNKNIKIKSIENIGEDLKQLTKSICSQVLPKNIKCKQIHTSSNITVAESEDNDISSTNFVQPSHVSKKSKKIKKHKLLDNILGETENTLDNENVKDNNRLKKKSVDSSKYSLKDQVQSNATSESNLISSQNDGFSTDTIQSSQISEKSKKRKKKKANSECQEEKLLLNSEQNLSTNQDKCFPGDEKKSVALEDNSYFSLQKLKVENIDNKIDAQDVSTMTKERLTQVKKLDLLNNSDDDSDFHKDYSSMKIKNQKLKISNEKKSVLKTSTDCQERSVDRIERNTDNVFSTITLLNSQKDDIKANSIQIAHVNKKSKKRKKQNDNPTFDSLQKNANFDEIKIIDPLTSTKISSSCKNGSNEVFEKNESKTSFPENLDSQFKSKISISLGLQKKRKNENLMCENVKKSCLPKKKKTLSSVNTASESKKTKKNNNLETAAMAQFQIVDLIKNTVGKKKNQFNSSVSNFDRRTSLDIIRSPGKKRKRYVSTSTSDKDDHSERSFRVHSRNSLTDDKGLLSPPGSTFIYKVFDNKLVEKISHPSKKKKKINHE